MGRGSRPPGFSPKRSRAVQTLGSYPGPGSRVWLSCSQGVLAVESASHEAQVRGSQKNAFPTHIVRLRVWETKLFFFIFYFGIHNSSSYKTKLGEVWDEEQRARWECDCQEKCVKRVLLKHYRNNLFHRDRSP